MSGAQAAITEWLAKLCDICRHNGVPGGFHYAGIGDFLLQHGTWYELRPLPKYIERGEPRACFRNATLLSIRGYTYVEGYAVPRLPTLLLPVHHAWCLDKNGKLVDNTWKRTGRAYFGVTFPLEVVLDSNGRSVLDCPERDFDIFRQPFGAVPNSCPSDVVVL